MSRKKESQLEAILIASVIPYFLEKGNFWFEENLGKILQVRKTQSFWKDNTLYLERNQYCDYSGFLRKLDEMGYEKTARAPDPGEFSKNGGIIEIFPVNSSRGARFDFNGNIIENIERLRTETENKEKAKQIRKKKSNSEKIFGELKELKPGEYLVHLDHGIGKFLGLSSEKAKKNTPGEISQIMAEKPAGQDYYILEYARGDKLYVPKGLERKLSRYFGFREPKISGLNSPFWGKTKRKARENAEKLAKELLDVYAKREMTNRPPYVFAQEIDGYIEAAFPFEETQSQIQAIREVEKDLKKDKPMDRIVCGDVGFGKTEIALRTMVKAITGGRQAVMLCPTTILAEQHYQNFTERLINLPVRIKMLSRLQPKKEQKKTIEELKGGKIDILVGTHRILSKDIEEYVGRKTPQKTKDRGIGLLVIDDEQKFGVKQKERLKKIRPSLDILSLSATPIPRTLYLALSSLKEISIMQTAPPGRLPVKTFVIPWSKKIIKKAIQTELSRNGQVYFLHNRVKTITAVKKYLENMASASDKWRIGIIHGKMEERRIIKTLKDFRNKKINILLATTIIENGLDLPDTNTLIVSDAAKLGLSQAHQIRGRIGRTNIKSFAYFFYSGNATGQNKTGLSETAEKRLNFLKETAEPGSGYRIALKDLEIRGAGNILGKEQSGNINQVGLNLYCQMLSETLQKLRKRPQNLN